MSWCLSKWRRMKLLMRKMTVLGPSRSTLSKEKYDVWTWTPKQILREIVCCCTKDICVKCTLMYGSERVSELLNNLYAALNDQDKRSKRLKINWSHLETWSYGSSERIWHGQTINGRKLINLPPTSTELSPLALCCAFGAMFVCLLLQFSFKREKKNAAHCFELILSSW